MRNAPRFLVALSALVMNACDQAPTQPDLDTVRPTFNTGTQAVDRYVEEAIYDFDGSSTFIDCGDGTTSEEIQLQGQLYMRATYLSNPAGGYTYNMHTMPIEMRGIGLTTGEVYRVSERQLFSATHSTMGTTGAYRTDHKFVSEDSKSRFRMVTRGHYTVNANGELVVDRNQISYVCES